MLGHTTVNYVQGKHKLAVIDSTLAGTPADKMSDPKMKIDNFTFTPKVVTVHPGETVTWINKDDVPHKVVSVDKKFSLHRRWIPTKNTPSPLRTRANMITLCSNPSPDDGHGGREDKGGDGQWAGVF